MKSRGKKVLGVPAGARELHVQLLMCGHVSEADHSDVVATLNRLCPYCVWKTMEVDAAEFRRLCLYCADYKTGATDPRPLAATAHGKAVGDVVHFDFLHVGESEVGSAMDTDDSYKYILVVEDDLSGFP